MFFLKVRNGKDRVTFAFYDVIAHVTYDDHWNDKNATLGNVWPPLDMKSAKALDEIHENVLEKGILKWIFDVTPSLQIVNTQAPQPSFLHPQPLKISLSFHLLPNPAVMAVLRVHGSPISTAVMRVVAALYEKGLEFEFVTIDMKAGQHKSEAFLALNVSWIVFSHDRGKLFANVLLKVFFVDVVWPERILRVSLTDEWVGFVR